MKNNNDNRAVSLLPRNGIIYVYILSSFQNKIRKINDSSCHRIVCASELEYALVSVGNQEKKMIEDLKKNGLFV